MAPSFAGTLCCVQMRIFSGVMIECASNLEGIKCFVPIHCLESKTKDNVKMLITTGLTSIMKRAETRRWNGKKTITLKTQNIIDPFLAALYNAYSLSAALTDPYKDCTTKAPDSVTFTIDTTFISEGEEDSCKIEILLHDDCEIVIFAWKEFKRDDTFVFLRHKKTTWSFSVKNGNMFEIIYHIFDNKMTYSAGEMDRIVGWPKQRMSIIKMIEELNLKNTSKFRKLSKSTYKWIKKMPQQYLEIIDMDLDLVNEDGLTLLHVLAETRESKYMKWIIDKIKIIDAADNEGKTPLHKACDSSNCHTAKILLQNGANVNALTKNGNTPLMLLASQKKPDKSFVKMLLDFNAKKDIENHDKMRAIDLAQMSIETNESIQLFQPM